VGLQVGTRLRAQNSACEVIVVKGADGPAVLLCAGAEMLPTAADPAIQLIAEGPAVQLGKRYTDEETGVEVLCTKAGVGPLALNDRELALKAAKALPASD